MSRAISLALALCLALLSNLSVANEMTTVDYRVIDTFVSDIKNIIKLPTGTAVAVVKGDEIVYEGYFGYRDIKERKPVTKDTVFYIASMTKAFFAQMALIKEQQGELDTAWTLQKLYPDIKFIPALKADQVTISNLLGHTGGIDNWPLVQATAYTGLHNKSEIDQIIAESYVNKDGALGQFAYSNVGYNLLSHWMDSHWDKSWQDNLASVLFTPLGMEHTSAYMSDAKKNKWQLANGYSVKSPTPEEPVYLTKVDSSMQSAGGMISTAPDIARFLMAQINLGKVGSEQVLPQAAIEKSQEFLASFDFYGMDRKYAYGWFAKERMGTQIFEHRGGYAGASTYMSYMPEHKVGLVVLSNQDKWGGDLAFALEDIAYSIALGKPGAEVDALVEKSLQHASKKATKFYASKKTDTPPHVEEIPADYLGQFNHAMLGSIYVKKTKSGAVELTWGNLHSKLMQGNETSQLLVEFVPNNREEIVFALTSTGQVQLEYADYRFIKKLTSS